MVNQMEPMNVRRSPLLSIADQHVHQGDWLMPVFSEAGERSRGVTLADYSARSKVIIEGDNAFEAVATWADFNELPIGSGQRIGDDRFVYRLRQDQLFLDGPVDDDDLIAAELRALAAGAAGLVTVTNVTDGRAMIALFGEQSRTCLSRLCSLDLSDQAFPNHGARQSSVAKTRQLILRRDAGGERKYFLCGGRSLSRYLWETIETAGRDL